MSQVRARLLPADRQTAKAKPARFEYGYAPVVEIALHRVQIGEQERHLSLRSPFRAVPEAQHRG